MVVAAPRMRSGSAEQVAGFRTGNEMAALSAKQMALGTNPNPLVPQATAGIDVDPHGCITAEPQTGATSREGVYAGGDIVTGAATVILAMGAGRRAATAIHGYLQQQVARKGAVP